MDQKQFLQAVVPWGSGNVVITWRRPDHKWPGRSCRVLADALQVIADLVTGPNDIYFCLSTNRLNSGSRKGSDALMLNAVWIDADVRPDKPDKYASIEEAIADLLFFCQQAGIPYPSIIVDSGSGIHAYWLSHRSLTVDEWRPFANALKAAAMQYGLKFDAGCTIKVVQILRVPGTRNQKYDPPPLVRILQKFTSGERHDFSDIFSDLLELAPPDPASADKSKIEISPAFKAMGMGQKLGENIAGYDKRPLPLEPILKECAWLREAYETGGKKFDNPQWNLTNLAATFLEDGHELAHRFGNQHPDYTREKTDKEWERKNRERGNSNIGWPKCRTISDNGSRHCKSCKHFFNIKSPLSFGFAALPPPPVPEEDEEIVALGGSRPPELRLPQGYCVNEQGKICAVIHSKVGKNGKSVEPGRLLPLFHGRFSNISLHSVDGVMGLAFTSTTDFDGTADIFLDVHSCCKKEPLYKVMSDRNVGHIADVEVETMGAKFTSSWLELLTQEDKATPDQGTMGWHHKGGEIIGFAYGSNLYHSDGSVLPLRALNDEDFRSWYQPEGKREVWVKAAKLLTDRKRPELDILISVAFAAPLTIFAGTLYGAILSIHGPPGTSKSTGQQVAASTWGHPKQTRESLNSTPKSIQGRLGRIRNLPAYWDDVQDERHQEALFQTMFVASEGAEGGRLNPDASYKQRLEWQTLLVACSNASFVDYLTKKQKSTTAGMRRVFEIYFPKRDDEPGIIDPTDASLTFAALEHNFGVIGAEYARMLAREHKEIKVMVSDTIKDFTKKVEGVGDESFWWNMCGVLLAGATLAQRLGAEMDVPAMEEFLINAFMNNRKLRSAEGTEGGSYANTEQSLTAFLNHFAGSGNIIFVKKMFEHRHMKVDWLYGPEDKCPIYIQVARDERKIVISKRAMREFFWKNEIQPRQVFVGMEKHFKAKEARITLGAGTSYAQTQEACYEIAVPYGEYEFLEHLLVARGKSE